MKCILFLMSLVVAQSSIAQTDTLYFDPASGNYIVRYIGVIHGSEDTLITFSYEPPTKIDPIIQSFVSITVDGKYLYRYKITNGTHAQQNLNEFSLHYDSTVWVESRTPETSWRNYTLRMRDYSDLHQPERVSTWVWRGDQGLEATWYIDSCIIASEGLPTTTDSYCQAKRRILVWPADQKDPSNINISARLLHLEVYPNANVLRKTIGPKPPPNPFVLLPFLDTLLSYTRQSAQLGWLGINRDDDCDDDERPDDGVVRNIENRLQKARRELVRGDSVKARRELEKLVRKVDRLQRRGERVMTSEAYALLKYNTEYLIEQLPERRRR